MKWPESESGCKEHPSNKQITGVCSYCLRDKLSQLYVDSTIKASGKPSSASSSSSLSASPQQYSSFAASSNIYVYRPGHFRNASAHAVHSISAAPSMFIGFNNNGLMRKSRSTAFASRSRGVRDRGIVNASNWGRRKDGFWSKLLRLTKKGTKENSVSVHSSSKSQGRG